MYLRTVVFRYRQFGGLQVLRFYAKNGALGAMFKTIISKPFDRHTYRKAYSVAIGKVEPYLRSKYAPLMEERKAYYASQNLEHTRNKIVWFCWLQGIEKAPDIIKACYGSLRKYLEGREVKVIDGSNWNEYVELPEYIVEKWNKGVIPPALFTDLLRLQLLILYGGSWIDSTVLCTGFKSDEVQVCKGFLDADLFVFQYTPKGTAEGISISNWFITACTSNELLMVLRDMLFAYWKDYDCTLDYYIFHLFFTMLAGVNPEQIAAMPYGYSMNSLALGYLLGETFNKDKWEQFTSKVCFHKLLYNLGGDVLNNEDNYYHHILKTYKA